MHRYHLQCRNTSWAVTVVWLLLVNQHSSPVDDCPHFEDTTAFTLAICRARLSRRNHDLGAVRAAEASDGGTDHVLAKLGVQTRLPPLFRLPAWASPVRMQHWRHYTPATEYVHDPPHTLRAVLSMIDLDLAVAKVVDKDAGVASGRRVRSWDAVKRCRSASGSTWEVTAVFEEANEGHRGERWGETL
ncbi:hypothetical protein EDB87DRAFT_1688276 [Lactarius vividus]|nr:hypothetical protein EDB87DRAFT_1688276 [Lactarius vividus]